MARVLRPGGIAAIFEHNPLNPLTRRVVSNCVFDEDAVLLRRRRARGLLRQAGLVPVRGPLHRVPALRRQGGRADRGRPAARAARRPVLRVRDPELSAPVMAPPPELSAIVLCYRAGESIRHVIEPLYAELEAVRRDLRARARCQLLARAAATPRPAVVREFARRPRPRPLPRRGQAGCDGLGHAQRLGRSAGRVPRGHRRRRAEPGRGPGQDLPGDEGRRAPTS